MTLRTKGAEKNANNLGTFLENIPIVSILRHFSSWLDFQRKKRSTVFHVASSTEVEFRA